MRRMCVLGVWPMCPVRWHQDEFDDFVTIADAARLAHAIAVMTSRGEPLLDLHVVFVPAHAGALAHAPGPVAAQAQHRSDSQLFQPAGALQPNFT